MAPVSKHDDCPFKDVVFPTQERTPEPDRKMDTRVGRLEGVVESLTRDIQEVSQNINMMGKEMGSFREMIGETLTRMREGFTAQIEAVTDRLTTSSKPQWQTISAFVALAVTLLGMAGAVVALIMSGQSQNITDLKKESEVITERMFQNQYEKGKSDAFAAETSSHLAKLDTTLQREMALMQQTTDSKIAAVDKNTSGYIDKFADAVKEFRLYTSEGGRNDARLTAKQEMILEMLKSLDERITRAEQLDERVAREAKHRSEATSDKR